MSNTKSEKRRRFYVDGEVQNPLARRIALQWLMFIVVCFGVVGFVQACIENPGSPLGEMFVFSLKRNLLPILTGFSLVPVFVHDTIRSTNRFAGPVTRLRETLREIAKDGKPRELTIRNDDYWSELGEEFNAAIAKIQSENAQKSPPKREMSVV